MLSVSPREVLKVDLLTFRCRPRVCDLQRTSSSSMHREYVGEDSSCMTNFSLRRRTPPPPSLLLRFGSIRQVLWMWHCPPCTLSMLAASTSASAASAMFVTIKALKVTQCNLSSRSLYLARLVLSTFLTARPSFPQRRSKFNPAHLAVFGVGELCGYGCVLISYRPPSPSLHFSFVDYKYRIARFRTLPYP